MGRSCSAVTSSGTGPHTPSLSPNRNRTIDFPSDLPMSLKRLAGDLTSSSPPSPSKKSLAEYTGLSVYQQKLLVQSWPNIFSTGANGQFASSIFTNLSNKNAKAKQLLTKANSVAVFSNDMMDCSAMHAKLVVELIDNIIKNLENEHCTITQQIVEIGRMHRGLKPEGLGIQMWDEFGDSIIESLRRFDAVRKHKELRRAWLAIVVYITDNLKQGQSITRFPSNYDINQSTDTPPRAASPYGKRSNASDF
ncbi:hypothetical protein WR25_19258 [Diploscapter pachys]|uniref:Globin domain-containing protein n=1 Tax=Diploscapter pachys TaxID=2018661 RepID=A0A2A2L7N2_9BILA|nr:hypothetical protein WR25_19258 [Diploscapter pachys]